MTAIFTPYQIISPHPVKSAWDEAINPYWASADPPSQTRLMTRAAISAKAIRIPEISHQLTPVRDATADSINKLCEKDNIIARIKTSFTVKSNETIAPIPAYKLRVLPSTRGIAASPGKPINSIKGDTKRINQSSTGVNCKIVTITVTWNTIFPNVHETRTPCCRPFNTVCLMSHEYFLFFKVCCHHSACWIAYFYGGTK